MTLLDLNILNQPTLLGFYAASCVALLFLFLARPSRRRLGRRVPSGRHFLLHGAAPTTRRAWLLGAAAASLAGALIAVLVLYLCEVVFDVFGMPLEPDTRAWVIAAFAATSLALVSLWRSRWWRRLAAAISAPLFIVTAALAINASFGLNTTVGALLNINVPSSFALPQRVRTPNTTAQLPLWKSWRPPALMPATGRLGQVFIPPTASGFQAREAYLYLPPAALVKNPPDLPVIIMMMGQPGGPGQSKTILSLLDGKAQENHGLGPIVLTVDQLGDPSRNPLCINSPRGKVYTYLTKDVVNFIHQRLNVASGPQQWAVGGYSNGGECALSFGAKRAGLFGSILDISGEIAPESGSDANTLKEGFGGNKAAFQAEKPLNILKKHHYSHELAIFTSGTADPIYSAQANTAAAAAHRAGMQTARFIGQGVGHRADALRYGMSQGLNLLYPRFGLSAP